MRNGAPSVCAWAPLPKATAGMRRLRSSCGALQVHGFGYYVGIFQACAGVEQDHAVAGLEKAGAEEAVIGGGGCCAFWGEEQAFVFCPILEGGEDFGVG